MDNPAAPIPSTSPRPAVSSLPVEALAKAGPAESSSRRWFLWFAGGLAILIFGIAIGIFSAKIFNQSQNQSQLPPTPSPTLLPIPSLVPDPTADWKTYTNKKHTYFIKLPQGWQPDRGYPGGQYSDEQLQTLDSTTWFKNSSIFSVQVLFECSSTTDVCFKKHQSDADKTGGPYTTKNTTTEMSPYLGQSALVARSSYKANFTVKGVFVVQRGKLWMFEIQSIDQTIETETAQILSTFKFLDQDNVSNLCATDADCGVNICDCKADLNQNIPVAKKVCDRYCPGAPRCINNRCQLVDENK